MSRFLEEKLMLAIVAALVPLVALAEGPTAVTSVHLVKATEVRSTSKEQVTGSLSPSKTLPLGFEVGGRLSASRVQKGDVVKAGQHLGSLDAEIVSAQVAQAEAGVAAAEASAELARDVAGRQEKLKAEGSVTEVQSRSSDTQKRQAEANLLMARASLAQVKAARRRHDLLAPFGGMLVDAPEQVGGMVGPGLPVYVLQQLDPLVLKTTIPEALRAVVKPGLKARVESVATGAGTDDATVRLVLPVADPQTRRVPVEVLVPNADGRFVANSLARVFFPVGDAQRAFTIPTSALGATGGEHVFVIDSGSRLKRVAVTVTARGLREITVAAVQPLTEVVDAPSAALVEGAVVSLR